MAAILANFSRINSLLETAVEPVRRIVTLRNWAIGGATFLVIGWMMEHTAAMRGTRGAAPPKWFDKGLRLLFFFLSSSPLVVLVPQLLPLLLLYLPSYLDGSEKAGGRPSEWLANSWIWRAFARRFNLKLVATTKLTADRQYIFGLHPHGILPLGGMINFLSNASGRKKLFPGIDFRTLAASFVFYIQGYRDLALAGGVVDASRYSARRLLDEGKSLMLVPGGATEALYAKPGANTLVLNKRLGFVRLAIQTGASLVPAYSFGENEMFDQFAVDNGVVQWVKARFQGVFGISLPLLKSIIPRHCSITTVVGAPIHVKQNPDPTNEEVQEVLEEYKAALQDLFDDFKRTYAPADDDLVLL